ncbi:hypothetical protein EVAR_920_1 [Eumeta japonica]|uniref:Uncharacterized protein n=1 Tax=Eumeta variegata TaxID=151549 RepID=A0A4C1SE29_EUMVA|nr:hypothetical protein EVAR_920_1 [Eumeta japonica]
MRCDKINKQHQPVAVHRYWGLRIDPGGCGLIATLGRLVSFLIIPLHTSKIPSDIRVTDSDLKPPTLARCGLKVANYGRRRYDDDRHPEPEA